MKKLLTLTLVFLLAFSAAGTALAANETVLTTEVEASYVIIIPTSTDITYGATSTSIGNIGLSEAKLGPYDYVLISATNLSEDGEGELVHTNTTDKIAYVMEVDGVGANGGSYDAVEQEAVTVAITAEAWAAAPVGEYSHTITFNVELREVE